MYFSKYKYPNRLKVKGWKKIYHASTNQNKAEGLYYQSKFRAKTINRDKESRFTMTKESIHQEVIAILIQSYKIHEAKTGRAKRKNRQIQY